MITWSRSRSSYKFIIVISLRLLSCHTCMQSRHQLLILLWCVGSCSVLPHHISNLGSLSDTQMLYVFVCFFISSFYLSYYRKYISSPQKIDLHGRIRFGFVDS